MLLSSLLHLKSTILKQKCSGPCRSKNTRYRLVPREDWRANWLYNDCRDDQMHSSSLFIKKKLSRTRNSPKLANVRVISYFPLLRYQLLNIELITDFLETNGSALIFIWMK